MTFGLTPLGLEPLGYDGADYDQSTVSAFSLLLADPSAPRRFLVTIDLQEVGTTGGADETLYLSADGFISLASDAPASTYFLPLLVDPLFSYDRSVSDVGRLAGAASAAIGRIPIAIGSGELDAYLPPDYEWSGGMVTVYMGGADFTAFADFEPIFVGRVADLEWSPTRLDVIVTDLLTLLENPVQTTTYAGTGGAEGSSDLAGQLKPKLWGQGRSIEPVFVRRSGQFIFQFNDGPSEAVDAVWDQGQAITADGNDYVDAAALEAASVTASHYATCLAEGLVRLGSEPAGVVVMDARGDASGSGYVDTAGAIIRRLLSIAGFTDPADLDVLQFVEIDARAPYTVGLYVRDGATISELVARLAASVFAFYGITRSGRFGLQVIRAPGAAVETYTDDDILEIQRLTTPQPIKRLRVGYRQLARPLSASEFATAVSAADREALSVRRLVTEWSDDSIAVDFPDARTLEELDLLIDETADAEALRDIVKGLLVERRDLYRVLLGAQPFARDWLQSVGLTSGYFNLGDGKRFRIVGLAGNASETRVSMLLWG